jgi:hypothetical protein
MDDRDLIESLAKTLASVAKSLELTRIELDGMRTVFIGTLAALSASATQQDRLARAIGAAIEGDTAQALNSQMSDETLRRREEWMQRLIPQRLWKTVQQYRVPLGQPRGNELAALPPPASSDNPEVVLANTGTHQRPRSPSFRRRPSNKS